MVNCKSFKNFLNTVNNCQRSITQETPLYMYCYTSYDDGDEEEEGNCTQVCWQVQEAMAS